MAETLFGMSPTDIQAQRQAAVQAQAAKYASMSPAEQVNYGGYMAGNQLGNALMGMMGAKDPEIERATLANKLAQETDFNDLDSVKALVGKLNQAGATREAMSLLPRIDALEKASEDRKVKREVAQAKGTSKDPSLTGEERMAKFVAEIQDKLDQGVEVSTKDLNQAKMYAEILRKQKTFTDKAGNILGVDQRSVPSLGSTPTGAVTGAPTSPVKPLGQTPEGRKTEAEAAEKKEQAKAQSQLLFDTDIANLEQTIATARKGGTGWMNMLTGWMPNSKARTVNNLVNTNKSAQLLSALEKLKEVGKGSSGLGPLTEKEGAKVESRVRSLDPQSETFISDLEYIKDYMKQANDILKAEGTGTKTTAPDVEGARERNIQKVMARNPKATREQVIQKLKEAGKY